MNTTTEYQRTAGKYTKQVIRDGDTYTAIMTDNVSGAQAFSSGWHSYAAALRILHNMYDNAIRRSN